MNFDLSTENLLRIQKCLYNTRLHPGLNRFFPYLEVFRHSWDRPWTYADVDEYQRHLADGILRLGQSGRLLLSEVEPVVTLGKRSCASDLFQPPVPVYSTDRGGLATWHGTGQWVLFPVDRLEVLTGDRKGVRRLVDSLLNVALKVASDYLPDLEIRQGKELGLWSPRGKLASVGIHIQKGVVLHGLSLNVFRSQHSFVGIRPCGLDAKVDFLLGSALQAMHPEQVFEQVGEKLAQVAIEEFYPASSLRLS